TLPCQRRILALTHALEYRIIGRPCSDRQPCEPPHQPVAGNLLTGHLGTLDVDAADVQEGAASRILRKLRVPDPVAPHRCLRREEPEHMCPRHEPSLLDLTPESDTLG